MTYTEGWPKRMVPADDWENKETETFVTECVPLSDAERLRDLLAEGVERVADSQLGGDPDWVRRARAALDREGGEYNENPDEMPRGPLPDYRGGGLMGRRRDREGEDG
jgi:hypothetical protein